MTPSAPDFDRLDEARSKYGVEIRRTPSGKTIFYYRTYDPQGVRTTAHSTGQTTRSAARAYCRNLLKQGCLIPSPEPTFSEYAAAGGSGTSAATFKADWPGAGASPECMRTSSA
jgi:hypothetical protein